MLINWIPALKSKTQTPEKEISPNQTFYENLPFRGLKRPPTQVRHSNSSRFKYKNVQVISRESCDYADCDYADCDYADYADGPLSYNATSKLQALLKKTENEEKEPWFVNKENA